MFNYDESKIDGKYLQAFVDAVDCYQAGDMNGAFNNWKMASEGGMARAYYYLGCCYFDGLGTAVDKALGIEWMKKAHSMGDLLATADLGKFYMFGLGVEKDPANAVGLFHLAADGGNARAAYMLCYAYATGEGVERDLEKAYMLCEIAADMNDVFALNELGNFYYNHAGYLSEYDAPCDTKKAYAYFKKAADLGYDAAKKNLENLSF